MDGMLKRDFSKSQTWRAENHVSPKIDKIMRKLWAVMCLAEEDTDMGPFLLQHGLDMESEDVKIAFTYLVLEQGWESVAFGE